MDPGPDEEKEKQVGKAPTVRDALAAVRYLVEAEHPDGAACGECRATLALVDKLERRLQGMALLNVLLDPAARAAEGALLRDDYVSG